MQDDGSLNQDPEHDEMLRLLLELPTPSSDLMKAYKASDEMDDDLVALQAMMGLKTKSWAKVLMFLEGVLEWETEVVVEVEALMHGVEDGVTWEKLHHVFEHLALAAGQKLDHKPWWKTGEWQKVEVE